MQLLPIKSDDDIARCTEVMRELRPHVAPEDMVARCKQQMTEGYQMLAVFYDDAVIGVAGYRISHNLAWGKNLYVDDLVTATHARSKGVGKVLLDALIAQCRTENVQLLHLDSGVQRYAAHRFYLREKMAITAHHFTLEIE